MRLRLSMLGGDLLIVTGKHLTDDETEPADEAATTAVAGAASADLTVSDSTAAADYVYEDRTPRFGFRLPGGYP